MNDGSLLRTLLNKIILVLCHMRVIHKSNMLCALEDCHMINIYYCMGWSVIWRDIARVGFCISRANGE